MKIFINTLSEKNKMYAAIVVVCLKTLALGLPIECRVRHRLFNTEKSCVAFSDQLKLQAIPDRFAVDIQCREFDRPV